MNLIFLDKQEACTILDIKDPRAQHIVDVLKMNEGDFLYVGTPNGPKGKACIRQLTSKQITISIIWETTTAELLPVTLVIGTPRPQTARKILREASSMGVEELCFYNSEKGDNGYAQSSLWKTNEWQHLLHQGAEQAFVTSIPRLTRTDSLSQYLANNDFRNECVIKVALDNYESTHSFPQACRKGKRFMVALGPERGFSQSERNILREHNFTLTSLGPRILRLETCCVVTIALISSELGHYNLDQFENQA